MITVIIINLTNSNNFPILSYNILIITSLITKLYSEFIFPDILAQKDYVI